MNYVLEKISTVQACDALLAGAKKKKQDLERRVRNLGESLVTFRKRLEQVQQESLQLLLLFEIFAGAYVLLPEGKYKVNLKIKLKRIELQQAILRKKATVYNTDTLLAKELQYNRLDSQVTALQDYIAAIAQQLAALEAPAFQIVQPTVLVRQAIAGVALIPALRLLQTRPGQGDYLNLPRRFNVA